MKIGMKKIILYIILLFLLVLLTIFNKINMEYLRGNEFNFITVSTIFAGFLFTALGILTGFYSNQSVKRFERIPTMDRIHTNIMLGIIFSIISVVFSISIVLISFGDGYWGQKFFNVFSIIETYFLLLTIIQFSISVKNIYFILTVVRSEIKKKLPPKEEVDNVLKKIK